MPRERPGDEARRTRAAAPPAPRAPAARTRTARTRSRPIRSSARAAACLRKRLPARRRCPDTGPPRPAAGRSGHNPRKRRPFSPTASFRVNSGAAKIDGGRHGDRRNARRDPQRRQRHRRQPLADAARDRRRAERRRTARRRRARAPIRDERARGKPEPHSRLSASSTDRGVGAAAAQPAAQRDPLVDVDVDAAAACRSPRCSARAARTARSSSAGNAGHVACAHDRAVVAHARASACRRSRARTNSDSSVW